MITQSSTNPASLSEIERELSQPGLRIRFRNVALERFYLREYRLAARLHNRIVVCITAAIFDAFIIPEIHASPEVVRLSAILRFAVFTPVILAYVLLDWRGMITRWVPATVTTLLIVPTVIATVESAHIVSPTAVINLSAVPLLMLAVLTCRVSISQALAVNAVCCLLYIWSVLTAPFIPAGLVPSMILTDLGVGIGTLAFAWRLELRDRQVFLFTRHAAIGRDMLAAQNRTLARLTQVDALTGLGNRRCFDETVSALWAAAAAAPARITLILFDIDCFKQFNDAFGHQAGDECLGAVARTVTRCLRDEHDILVRYGGEEFAIILADTSLEDGCVVAERVRDAMVDRALPHPGGGPLPLVTVSLGVASVLAPVQTSASLVEAADRMLYTAKGLGRNRVMARQDDGKQSFFEEKDQKTSTPATPASAEIP